MFNIVFNILLEVYNGKSWKEAFEISIPRRKNMDEKKKKLIAKKKENNQLC